MISIQVDASLGVSCKPGEFLRKGQFIGKSPGNVDESVVAPYSGIVRSIEFQNDSHILEIIIEPTVNNV